MVKTTKVLNVFCRSGHHDKCKGISRATRSDPETFICTCECHQKVEASKERQP